MGFLSNPERRARFTIPAEYVTSRVRLTAPELAAGFEAGWLGPEDVVKIAETKHRNGESLAEAESQLALLLPDDLERVPELCEELIASSDEPAESRARVWMFLTLAWLLDHKVQFEDPLSVIEELFGDFEYPAEMTPLVGFLPARAGDPVGVEAIESRWRDFVERLGLEYRIRES
jgi:hypothetical protein